MESPSASQLVFWEKVVAGAGAGAGAGIWDLDAGDVNPIIHAARESCARTNTLGKTCEARSLFMGPGR